MTTTSPESQLKPRNIQTKLKHEILIRYLEKWGYIITSGVAGQYRKSLQTNRRFYPPRLIYVDCFAFTGRYHDLDSQTIVMGSPLIGLEALDKIKEHSRQKIGFEPEIISILIEEKKAHYKALRHSLEAFGYTDRVRETDDLTSLRNGDVAVIQGDARDYIAPLCELTSQPLTWSFFLLDPYGPSGIPLRPVVAPIISLAHADVMINVPYHDLHRKLGPAARGEQEDHTAHYDAMFGSNAWRQLAEQYLSTARTNVNKARVETDLTELYLGALQTVDTGLGIKEIGLEFPDRERTFYYLVLTTHDPTGGFETNQITAEASIRQFLYKDRRERTTDSGTQLSFLGDAIPDPNQPTLDKPDIPQISTQIFERCHGEALAFREVMRRLIRTRYMLADVKKAMTDLKHQGKAHFEGKLTNNTLVHFSKS